MAHPIEERVKYLACDMSLLYNEDLLGWLSQALIAQVGQLDAYDIAARLLQCVEHDCAHL